MKQKEEIEPWVGFQLVIFAVHLECMYQQGLKDKHKGCTRSDMINDLVCVGMLEGFRRQKALKLAKQAYNDAMAVLDAMGLDTFADLIERHDSKKLH